MEVTDITSLFLHGITHDFSCSLSVKSVFYEQILSDQDQQAMSNNMYAI